MKLSKELTEKMAEIIIKHIEQTTAKMSDEGYGVNYGKYQVDKAKGLI